MTTEARDLWIRPNDIWLVEMALGPTYTIKFSWATSITGTPSVAIYKDENTTDTAGTYMPDGSVSVSGNAMTMKQLKALTYGTYVLVILASPNGMPDAWKWQINVAKKHTRF